ncbi:Signal transduction response regulator, receiver domain, partial [Dillenia turbinata]
CCCCRELNKVMGGLDIPTTFEAGKGYETPCAGIRILVVDGNSKHLRTISELLDSLQYQVVPVNCAAGALFILREKRSIFDLLLIEINLPDMDGYEFLEKIQHEFNLPTIVMSTENNDVATYNCLVRGAMFCVSKPASRNDLKGLWQFAHIKERDNKRVKILVGLASSQGDNSVDSYLGIVSSLGVGSCGRKSKRGDLKDEGDGGPSRKRPRMVWTSELHGKFVEIVSELGIDKALPKQIFERMNVPGLKKSNISSHLQKYRLALKEKQETRQKPSSPLIGSTESQTWGSMPTGLQEELKGNDVMHHNKEECYTPSLKDGQSGVTSEQPSSGDSNTNSVGNNCDAVDELELDIDLSILEDSDFWSDTNISTLLDTQCHREDQQAPAPKIWQDDIGIPNYDYNPDIFSGDFDFPCLIN